MTERTFEAGYALAKKWVKEYGYEIAQKDVRDITDEARFLGTYSDLDRGLEQYFTDNMP